MSGQPGVVIKQPGQEKNPGGPPDMELAVVGQQPQQQGFGFAPQQMIAQVPPGLDYMAQLDTVKVCQVLHGLEGKAVLKSL